MKIKNYTSGVSVDRSLSAIETLLVQAGASCITRFYEDKRVAGYMFQMLVHGNNIVFKLPANPSAIRKILEADVKRPRRGTMNMIADQAEKTAWRLLHEWVHIQLSMIQMQQAEAAQIFLPYAYDGRSNETLFQKIRGGEFKMLSGYSPAEPGQ